MKRYIIYKSNGEIHMLMVTGNISMVKYQAKSVGGTYKVDKSWKPNK